MSAVAPVANGTFGPTAIAPAQPIEAHMQILLIEDQRAAKALCTQDRNDALAAALEAVCELASEQAERLAETCGHQKEHYLRLIFSGGAKRLLERKANPYNTWTHDLAKRYNQDLNSHEVKSLVELQREHRHEFDALTPQAKQALIAAYEEDRQSNKTGLRLSDQRGRVQDIRKTFKAMQDMFFNLKLRTGCDGFMCLVRNNDEISVPPMWYFTRPEINRCLGDAVHQWDIETISGVMEGFCIGGCDIMQYIPTNKEGADWMRKEISKKLNTMLSEITGNPRAVMAYKDYEGKIAIGNGVVLEGWTHDIFAAPSSLPRTTGPLRVLLDALHSGKCYFRRLTGAELAARQAEYGQKLKLKEGKIVPPKDDQEEGPSRKRARRDESPCDSSSDSSDDD